MKTPTHALIAYGLCKGFPALRLSAPAAVGGGVIPDIPVLLMGIAALYPQWNPFAFDKARLLSRMDILYFDDTFWITAHNSLHSPLFVSLLLLLAIYLRHARAWIDWMRSFLIGALSHAIIDVFTHRKDGPLLLWPFDWETRFHSPISHWDPAYYGGYMVSLELALASGFVCYRVWRAATSKLCLSPYLGPEP